MDVGLHPRARKGVGDHVAPEVDERRVLEGRLQGLALEQVDPHRCDEARAQRRNVRDELRQALGGRLFLEVRDPPQAVHLEDAESSGLLGRNRGHRHRNVGHVAAVRLEHPREVHQVELVPGEDQHVAEVVVGEVALVLPHRVGGALEPVLALRCLLGGEHLDESAGEQVQPVGLRDVPVERCRVELREDEDAADVGVQAVADRHVDQPVLPADRHRRLRAMVGERKQTRAAAAAKDQREDFGVHRHDYSKSYACNGHVNGI